MTVLQFVPPEGDPAAAAALAAHAALDATQAELDAAIAAEAASRSTGDTPEALHVIGGDGEPAFVNSWVSTAGFATVAFYKHQGRVYLQGTTNAGSAEGIFTLPAGYRPPGIIAPPVFDFNLGYSVSVTIDAAGAISVPASAIGHYIFLDGVSFRVA